MTYFLIQYNRRTGSSQVTPTRDRGQAMRERFRLEAQTIDSDLEVVVLGASDEATLRKTHGRYFATSPSDLAHS